ncbi:MAG: carbohydrate-binding domain-containing protein [Oscillospiraceae bacterium]|jgi:hypothetical protein|nr:carbohydrate-binding domain-containing protein [Oscillospiraceae bacterium]
MKKPIALVLTALLLLSLAACTRPAQPQNEENPSPTTTSPTVEVEDKEDDNAEDNVTPVRTIATNGTHTLSGDIGGQVLVTAEKVTLILDGARIHCADGAGILGKDGNGEDVLQALTIELRGESTITSGSKHGIQAKDALTLQGDGKLTINAGKDGIHASDALNIVGGTFHITAANDGIQSEKELTISGGNFTLKTGGGAAAVTRDNGSAQRGRPATPASTDTASHKGLKAAGDMTITDGTFSIDSADDSVHSNGNIQLQGGLFTLASGDDGVHADATLDISGGEINVTQSYEGLEGAKVNISAGTVLVHATDDGINAAGGNNESGGGAFGQDRFRPGAPGGGNSAYSINISGGTVTVYSGSDGVDSNGTLDITGGTTAIFVNAPRDGDATDTDGGGTILPALYGKANVPSGTEIAVGNWRITTGADATAFCLLLPGTVAGQSYTITAGGAALLTATATTTIEGMMMGGRR